MVLNDISQKNKAKEPSIVSVGIYKIYTKKRNHGHQFKRKGVYYTILNGLLKKNKKKSPPKLLETIPQAILQNWAAEEAAAFKMIRDL